MKKLMTITLSILLSCASLSAIAVGDKQSVISASKIATVPAKISINRASAKQLTALKGIGPKRAKDIVAYRQAHGSFKKIADLSKVKNINNKAVARLQQQNKGRMSIR